MVAFQGDEGGESDGGATDMTSEADIMENLRAMREEEEDKKRRQRVRDWDVGKEGVETSRQGRDTFCRRDLCWPLKNVGVTLFGSFIVCLTLSTFACLQCFKVNEMRI